MMKRLIILVITLLILIGTNYALTIFTNAEFLDYSFFVGMSVSVIIWFFTSKGGFTSRNADMLIQAITGIKQEEQKREFLPNIIFFTSVAYTLISLLSILIYYRDYFI